ncbi:MAG: MCE family protein [Chitinivibrionales bacterium]|nr:MCE family protein [Chitinivibrionales bacterium]
MSLSVSQRTRLGIFLVAGAVFTAIFAVTTIGVKLREREKTYYAIWEGESLSGLEPGAAVKFHGIRIGKVEKISYDPDNLQKIKVTMSIQHDFPMKEDMVAQLYMMGITMQLYVDILGGSAGAQPLPPNSTITTKQSAMSAITGKAEVIVAKLEQLLNNINIATHPDSIRAIKEIIDNVAVITADAKTFLDDVRPNINQMANSAQRIFTSVDSIALDVKQVTGELSGTIKGGQLAEILGSADSTLRSLKNISETMDLTLKQSREDIMISLENLREALENANELTKVLSENPSLLLRGDQKRERQIR